MEWYQTHILTRITRDIVRLLIDINKYNSVKFVAGIQKKYFYTPLVIENILLYYVFMFNNRERKSKWQWDCIAKLGNGNSAQVVE